MLENHTTATFITGATLHRLERTSLIRPEPDAVLIEAVARGSAASLRGLRAGDIILAANQTPVHSEEDLMRAARRAGRVLVLDIKRDDGRIAILIQ